MLADKTLLGATLLVTFLSGGGVGYLARDAQGTPPARPYAVETVFSGQLGELAASGYSPGELGAARTAYTEYLDAYQMWWNQFVDSHVENLDKIDRRLETRLGEIAAEHATRDGDPR